MSYFMCKVQKARPEKFHKILGSNAKKGENLQMVEAISRPAYLSLLARILLAYFPCKEISNKNRNIMNPISLYAS